MKPPPVALLFSGQGSQHVGMGAWLFREFPEAHETLAEAERTLRLPLGRIMACGPERQLRLTEVAQPAIVTLSVALLRVLGRSLRPVAVAGHSVGEFAALVAVGSLEFADAVRLVALRGALMQKATPPGAGGMLAVLGLTERELRRRCAVARRDGVLDLAAFNCPRQIVVSGEGRALRRLRAGLDAEGVSCVPLAVSAPFHSRLLAPAAEGLATALAEIRLRRPRAPIVSNTDGRALRSERGLRDRLTRQVVSPVRWEASVRTLGRLGARSVIEVGPGRALLGHVRRTDHSLDRFALESLEDLERVRRTFDLAEVSAPSPELEPVGASYARATA